MKASRFRVDRLHLPARMSHGTNARSIIHHSGQKWPCRTYRPASNDRTAAPATARTSQCRKIGGRRAALRRDGSERRRHGPRRMRRDPESPGRRRALEVFDEVVLCRAPQHPVHSARVELRVRGGQQPEAEHGSRPPDRIAVRVGVVRDRAATRPAAWRRPTGRAQVPGARRAAARYRGRIGNAGQRARAVSASSATIRHAREDAGGEQRERPEGNRQHRGIDAGMKGQPVDPAPIGEDPGAAMQFHGRGAAGNSTTPGTLTRSARPRAMRNRPRPMGDKGGSPGTRAALTDGCVTPRSHARTSAAGQGFCHESHFSDRVRPSARGPGIRGQPLGDGHLGTAIRNPCRSMPSVSSTAGSVTSARMFSGEVSSRS